MRLAVGRDERLGHRGHGAAIGRIGAHVFIGGERLHDGRGHLALQLGEIHRAALLVAHRAASTSRVRVSMEVALGLLRFGMNFVEAGNVVVPFQQRGRGAAALDGARVELPHRIDHRMVVGVENVLLVARVAGDVNLRHALRRARRSRNPWESNSWFTEET